MTTNEELADKYPVKYSRDVGRRRVTLGDLVEKFALEMMATLPSNMASLSEWIDREFLFGCWGHVMREVRERNFGRDIKGFIIEAYNAGLQRGLRGHKRSVESISPPSEPPPSAEKEEEWCWRESKSSESAFGPFASREDAIEEARVADDRPRTVLISRCAYPDPVFIAGHVIDLGNILESMEEFAHDNEHPYDDDIFDPVDMAEAEAALKRVVRAWAKVHIKPCTAWHTSEQEEEVEIEPGCRP